MTVDVTPKVPEWTDRPIVLQVDERGAMTDSLLPGMSLSGHLQELRGWASKAAGLHDFPLDYHRLQIEHWLWGHRADLRGKIMDIGVVIPRRWLGPDYFTFGLESCDVTGDLLALPFGGGSLDAAICTEVLEHVRDPWQAVDELWRVLKPGGQLLVTSPFAWPWHGTDNYDDYWRFTHQGWRLLLTAFSSVSIKACRWTEEALSLLDIVRRYEGWGFRDQTQYHTGYLVEAMK